MKKFWMSFLFGCLVFLSCKEKLPSDPDSERGEERGEEIARVLFDFETSQNLVLQWRTERHRFYESENRSGTEESDYQRWGITNHCLRGYTEPSNSSDWIWHTAPYRFAFQCYPGDYIEISANIKTEDGSKARIGVDTKLPHVTVNPGLGHSGFQQYPDWGQAIFQSPVPTDQIREFWVWCQIEGKTSSQAIAYFDDFEVVLYGNPDLDRTEPLCVEYIGPGKNPQLYSDITGSWSLTGKMELVGDHKWEYTYQNIFPCWRPTLFNIVTETSYGDEWVADYYGVHGICRFGDNRADRIIDNDLGGANFCILFCGTRTILLPWEITQTYNEPVYYFKVEWSGIETNSAVFWHTFEGWTGVPMTRVGNKWVCVFHNILPRSDSYIVNIQYSGNQWVADNQGLHGEVWLIGAGNSIRVENIVDNGMGGANIPLEMKETGIVENPAD